MDALKSTKNVKKKKTAKPFKCTLCSKHFPDKYAVAKHLRTHSTDTPFACTLCAYAGKTQQYLRRHVKVTHERDRKFECNVCGKAFHYGCKLKDHMRVHTGEKPYKCDECEKAFNSSYSLSTHKLIHAGSKPYQCVFCEYACRDTSTLRKHQARHMGTEKYYQCKVCDISLKSKAQLKLHVAEKHLNVDVKKFICDTCGKRFKIKSNLANHIQAVHQRSRTAKCDLCGVLLSNRGNLRAHMRIHVHHKPFVCTVEPCERRFKHTSSLTKHVRSHFPSKWLACQVCSKRFPTRRRLDRHLTTHQAKVKKVVCDHCGVRFYNKNYLSQHIKRKHSRKKQKFICDMCDFVTSNKPSIVMHIKYGHRVDNAIQCKMCEKKFKRDYNLKLHYWTSHGIKYKITIKKKPKKPLILIKTEPEEQLEDDNCFIKVVPKIEPLNDEDVLLEDLAFNDNQLQDIPEDVFDELIDPKEKRPDTGICIKPERVFVDKKAEEKVKRQVGVLLERTRKKKAATALERARRKYNRLMRTAVAKTCLKDGTTTRTIKYNNNNNNGQSSNSLLVEDYSISHETTDNKEFQATDTSNRGDDNVAPTIDTPTAIEGADKNTSNKIVKVKLGCNRKLNINVHQCYVCFKLYESKEKLLDHCKDHFDLCNIKTLKKCPLCEYATNLSVTRHLKKAHNINIKVPYGAFKDKKNNDGSRYYYEVGDEVIDKVEIIPSVKNLNRQASRKIDKRNRDNKNKGVMKTKLVKKGKEWIVVKEKLKINNYMLPKFDKIGDLNVKGGHVERMKVLSRLAKKKGVKMLFPCDSCDKICQTLSALKLHGRKHQSNPKPFRPKVWKHKAKKQSSMTQSSLRNDQYKPRTQVGSVSTQDPGSKLDASLKHVKSDRRRNQAGVSNEAYRNAEPKPVVTKHRCDKQLIEFYERNIKGGDIEFWQFLKIYNKMGRDNVNDFTDLDNTAAFGVHGNKPEEAEGGKKKEKAVIKKVVRRDAFKRVIRLSKKEFLRRNEIKMRLRENIRHNNVLS